MRPAPDAGPVLREVGLVFGLSLVGCWAFIGLGQLVPWVRNNLHAFVAALFLLLPAWILGRRGETLEDHGLNTRGLGRALLIAAAAAAITFPPYAVGNHYYQEILFQRPAQPAWSNYSAFPNECQGPPRFDAALSVWCERDRVHLRWTGAIVVEARGRGIAAAGGLPHTATPPGAETLLRFDRGGSGAIRVPPGGEVKISARRPSGPLRADEIELGSGRRPSEQPVELGRGLWWLLELLLAQLIAVALPEEVFYRGYLQDRLAVAFPRRRRMLGADIGIGAIVCTSALFSLGHFLLDLNPARLAVFFPSLVFGWIRCYTSTLAGCIVYHAFCNVLVRLLIVHY